VRPRRRGQHELAALVHRAEHPDSATLEWSLAQSEEFVEAAGFGRPGKARTANPGSIPVFGSNQGNPSWDNSRREPRNDEARDATSSCGAAKMSADIADNLSHDSTKTERDARRAREIFFSVLMILLLASTMNLFVDREVLKYLKYICWVTLTFSLVVAFFISHVRQLPTVGTAIAIAFTLIGCVTIGLGQLSTQSSFGSALVPFGVTALGYLTMGCGAREVQRYVTLTYIACGTILVAALIASRDTFFRVNEFSFVLVFGLVFSILLRDRVATVSIAIVIAISLVLRPSSTLFLGAVVGSGFAMFSGSRPAAAAVAACIVVASCAALAIAAMSDPDLAYSVGDVEAFVKESILGGESNSESRAALIVGVQQNFSKVSFLFGNLFMAETSPDVAEILGRDDFRAPVHSDFIQMLNQGGIVGIVAFCYFLIEMTFLHRAPEPSPEADFLGKAVPACVTIFAIYISFNPIMLNIEYSLWFFMLSFICLGLVPRST